MRPPRVEVKGEPSYVSGPGPFGLHAFMHCALRGDGSIDLVTLRAERGAAVEVSREVTSRKKLRATMDELRRSLRLYFAPAPGDYVAARMHAAWAARDAVRPWGPTARGAIESLPTGGGSHPTEVLDAAAAGRGDGGLGILVEPEGLMLLPRPSLIELGTARMVEHVSLPEAEREARMASVMPEVIDAHYDRPEREALSLSLRDLALVFLANRKPERALDAVAAAVAVRDASPLATPPHAVPIFTSLLYKALSLAQSAAREAALTRGSPTR